ncbi:MAG: hypothetical protein RL653_1603 [Pseudomonadota bacterium]|jgi:GNAT superfamily N-acetyltransferase
MTNSSTSARPIFRLRPARRGDADALRQLVSELGYGEAADMQTVSWVISHPEMEVFMAADALDKGIGMLALSHRPQLRLGGRIATFDEICVSPSWRRKGVGKALVLKAIERAKTLGVRRIEITTHAAGREEARAFCLACGFTEVGGDVMRLDFPAPRR